MLTRPDSGTRAPLNTPQLGLRSIVRLCTGKLRSMCQSAVAKTDQLTTATRRPGDFQVAFATGRPPISHTVTVVRIGVYNAAPSFDGTGTISIVVLNDNFANLAVVEYAMIC